MGQFHWENKQVLLCTRDLDMYMDSYFMYVRFSHAFELKRKIPFPGIICSK